MPWQEQSPMDLRESFIADWHLHIVSVVELCDAYGVSRKTGYKWIRRFEHGGVVALADQSRRPRHSPAAVAPAVMAVVCDAHARYPTWGSRKIRHWLVRRYPTQRWPSRVTIEAIWRRAGSYPARRPRRICWRTRQVLTPATEPNQVWTIDYKGDFRLGDRSRCYPLTLRDLASRYTLTCRALAAPDGAHTQRWVDHAFAMYGLPDCIRSDNGEPFAGLGLAGLSRLNVRWLRLGIRVEHIDPGRPSQNGAHEQFHRVLKAETTRPPAATVRGQQRRFDRFRRVYNEERPHEAHAGAVPADYYQPSPRPYPRRMPALEYEPHWEVRTVMTNGRIPWRGDTIFLSRALRGERVALEEVDDGHWRVHFASVTLAHWNDRDRQLRPLGQ